MCNLFRDARGPDSSVGVVTGPQTLQPTQHSWRLPPKQETILFSNAARPAQRSTQSSTQGVLGTVPAAVKWP